MSGESSFLMPIVLPTGNGGNQQATMPPARVLAAMKFLGDLTSKQAEMPCWSEIHGLETIKGQELVAEEVEARDSALGLLRNYFDCKMTMDERERIELEMKKHFSSRKSGIPIDCPNCRTFQRPQPGCR